MKPLFELLKEKVSERIGERVFYTGEIYNIIHRLSTERGKKINKMIIKNNLRAHRILPKDVELNPRQYGFPDANVSLYPQGIVWNYLRELDL